MVKNQLFYQLRLYVGTGRLQSTASNYEISNILSQKNRSLCHHPTKNWLIMHAIQNFEAYMKYKWQHAHSYAFIHNGRQKKGKKRRAARTVYVPLSIDQIKFHFFWQVCIGGVLTWFAHLRNSMPLNWISAAQMTSIWQQFIRHVK